MNKQDHFTLTADVLHWLVANQHAQPGLREIARQFNLSEFHLQKVFQNMAGVSPKQFLKYLTKEAAIERLRQGQTVFDAALDVGLSGSGRLHDLIVTTEAMTPGQARNAGAGVDLQYGSAMTPFGPALLAWNATGIAFLGFHSPSEENKCLEGLKNQWHLVQLQHEPEAAQRFLDRIFDRNETEPVKVWLRGSPFQLKVWEALLKIPAGSHCSYGQVASHIQQASASRAVGTAIGRNPVAWLIPCHRVITRSAQMGGYRWGINTKRVMIGYEAAIN